MAPSTLVVKPFGSTTATKVLDFFLSCDSIERIYITPVTEPSLAKQFKELCTPIEAAGGWVTNPKGEVLFIHRHGIWDLPKGKQDPGETLENTALREVQEETGVQDLTLGTPLHCTYHIYTQEEQVFMKCTHWYAMTSPATTPLTPQTEEGIEKAQWIPPEELDTIIQSSYPATREVFKAYQAFQKK